MEKDKKVVAGVIALLALFGIIAFVGAEPQEEVSAEILYASIEEAEGG